MSVEMRKAKEEELSKLVHDRFTCEIDLQRRIEIESHHPQDSIPSIEWYREEYRKSCIRVEAFKTRNAEYFI